MSNDFVSRLLKGDYCLESDLVDPISTKKTIEDLKAESLMSNVCEVYKPSETIWEEIEEGKFFLEI